jgi:uncharacterized protein (TIGR00297 family)
MALQLTLGFLFGAFIGWLAWRVGALSRSGAWAAALTGGLIFGLGGLPWAALLLVFFISSSALSRAFTRRKKEVSEKFSKGSRRDWAQVLANGGLGGLLVIAHGVFPEQTWPWIAYCGAMAAVNADTWATELGVLSRGMPRLITTGRLVERGASGGISLLGTAASLAGAMLIGFTATVFPFGSAPLTLPGPASLLVAASLGGLLGSLFDSFLGATVQAIYRCPNCGKETERHPFHTCGSQTRLLRGWRWLDNDMVNFACSLAGAATAVGVWRLVVR